MSTPLAVVVLCHADAEHFRRLAGALADIPIFVHCDSKTPAATFDALTPARSTNIQFCQRVDTRLSSWSLVRAELTALEAAYRATNATHIAVLSGADYPLVSVEKLVEALAAWQGRSFFWNVPMPYRAWDTPRHPSGGLWRLEHKFVTGNSDQVVFVRGFPLRRPWKRPIPAELEPRASSQWKIYDRDAVRRLLLVADQRPDLIKFWKSTLVPDESFAASVLGSRRLFGQDALAPCFAHAWYFEWSTSGSHHPNWLEDGSLEAICAAQSSPAATPDSGGMEPAAGRTIASSKLFARKFSSERSRTLLDDIDRRLRVRLPPT